MRRKIMVIRMATKTMMTMIIRKKKKKGQRLAILNWG